MPKVATFLFDTDFREPNQDAKPDAAIADAEGRGYHKGLAEGQRQAEGESAMRDAQMQARVAVALERLAQAAGDVLAQIDIHRDETEQFAMELALALARKLAGDALDYQPLAVIAGAAAQAFQHLRGVPHFVARVNDDLVEPVDALLEQLAKERGFEGRLVTLGDPDMEPGDLRLEWADGGIVRERAKFDELVAQTLGQSSR